LRDTVRDQIKANDPPEVASTFRRRLAGGIDESQAIESITAVVAAEMFSMMTQGRELDRRLHIEDLRRLPELPYDTDAQCRHRRTPAGWAAVVLDTSIGTSASPCRCIRITRATVIYPTPLSATTSWWLESANRDEDARAEDRDGVV